TLGGALLRLGPRRGGTWNLVLLRVGKTNADSIERFRASVARVIRHPKLKERYARRKKYANRSEVSVPSRQWRRNVEPGLVARTIEPADSASALLAIESDGPS